MDLNALLDALGARDTADAYRIATETSRLITNLQEATGTQVPDALLAAVREAAPLAKQIRELTGKPANEAIGVVLAWRNASEQLESAQKRVAELEAKDRQREVDDLIKQGQAEGKLTPALAEVFKGYTAEQLKAYLAAAPRLVPAQAHQPAPAGSSGGTQPAAVTADGRKYEDLRPAEAAALAKSDPALFKALRDDWEQRGRPRPE